MTKKVKRSNRQHIVGVTNHTGSVRFLLTVNVNLKTYDISSLKPSAFSMQVIPKGKLGIMFHLFDSMDDLYENVNQLANRFKPTEAEYLHCWEGGRHHIHKLDKNGFKKPRKCPKPRQK